MMNSPFRSGLPPAHDFDPALRAALRQLSLLRERFPADFPADITTANVYPPRLMDGLPAGANTGWTTGFWTGLLWLGYQLTDDAAYRQCAEAQLPSYAERLAQRINIDHHDMGFLYTPSCVAAWRLTGNTAARDAALGAADCLLGRYWPEAGIIQAWGDLDHPAERGRIIIDCLMNLPLLHWATNVSGNYSYREAALNHLQRSRDHLLRPDASSFHTFHFDVETGAPRYGSTAQGAADDSCWARGQAWGIYGFALNHRYAPELGLLDSAVRLADYFLAHLPSHGIAYWDLAFGEGSGEPWDSSASAIAACGLLELAGHLPASHRSRRYREAALQMLAALAEHCAGRAPASNALLLHGVYSKPHGQGIDEASLWGDYFYLEALARVMRDWPGHW